MAPPMMVFNNKQSFVDYSTKTDILTIEAQ